MRRPEVFEDANDHTHALLLELWVTSNLVRISRIAWSPTLKAHAAELAARKRKLKSELNALRMELPEPRPATRRT
jgi:hypothetical protein